MGSRKRHNGRRKRICGFLVFVTSECFWVLIFGVEFSGNVGTKIPRVLHRAALHARAFLLYFTRGIASACIASHGIGITALAFFGLWKVTKLSMDHKREGMGGLLLFSSLTFFLDTAQDCQRDNHKCAHGRARFSITDVEDKAGDQQRSSLLVGLGCEIGWDLWRSERRRVAYLRPLVGRRRVVISVLPRMETLMIQTFAVQF